MKFYFISPIDKSDPDLFPSFVETFKNEGHEIVENIRNAEIIFYDWFSWMGEFDGSIAHYAMESKLPIVIFDETDFGGMSKEVWNEKGWTEVSNERRFVYFMRKMDKTKEYPNWVYPYEKCIDQRCYFNQFVSKEHLQNRPFDVCFIGNNSPQRENFINSLVGSGKIKADIHWTNESGKVEHNEWVNRHFNSKMFISADGGGFGDERPYQLMRVAAFLKQRNSQLILNDFVDLSECIKIGDSDGNVSAEEIDALCKILNDTDYLYQIYLRGIVKLKTFYTEEYRAKYILSILKQEGIC